MIRNLLAVALVIATLLPASAIRAEDEVKKFTAAEVGGMVVANFPRAEGLVTEADEREVSIDIGSADGLAPGMTLYLFRGGSPILHPITKAVLGMREEPLGSVVLEDVSERESSGHLAELLVTRIVPGDTARLSTKAAKLQVVTGGPDVDAIVMERMLSELKGSGRLEVMGPSELPKDSGFDAGSASSLASSAGADDVLFVTTGPSHVKDAVEAGVKLFGADGKELMSFTGPVDVTPEIYTESSMDYALVRGDYRDFYVMEPLPFRGKHMAVGNVMGEGAAELVVSDGTDLVVYRFDNRVLHEQWRMTGETADNHLDVECADLNGNGTDEIYLTSLRGDVVGSSVLEYNGTTIETIAGPVGLLFRVLAVPCQPKKLLTTTKGVAEPYSRIVYEYGWKDGQLVKGERFELPGRIKDPYGFAIADFIPGNTPPLKEGQTPGPYDGMEIVWVDDTDYLQLLDMSGERIWKSPEHYGGYDNYFETARGDLLLPNVDPRGKVKGNLQVVANDDGGYDVVLARNIPMTYAIERLKGYTTADIFSLYWNGTAMEERWAIRNIEGYVANLHEGGVISPDSKEVVALIEPTLKVIKKSKKLPLGTVESISNISADKSSIMVYKAPQR